MSILKAVKLKVGRRKRANLSGIIKYVLKTEKTEEKLVYGHCLEVVRAYKMMIETKTVFSKTSGREYSHFVQSYPPDENITPEQALEQAKKLLEATKKFRAYEVLLAVHKDRSHIHVHYIVNSVSFVDGRKFHITKKELEELKSLQNEINIADGFSPAPQKGYKSNGEKRTEKVVGNKNTYQLLSKAEKGEVDSYVQNCAIAILRNKDIVADIPQFLELMKESGFETVWSENKKHVTFIDSKRQAAGEKKCKIRLATLAKYYPEFERLSTKEELKNVIDSNYGKSKNNSISPPNSGARTIYSADSSGSAYGTGPTVSGKSADLDQLTSEFADFQRAADAFEGAERARRKNLGGNSESFGRDEIKHEELGNGIAMENGKCSDRYRERKLSMQKRNSKHWGVDR